MVVFPVGSVAVILTATEPERFAVDTVICPNAQSTFEFIKLLFSVIEQVSRFDLPPVALVSNAAHFNV